MLHKLVKPINHWLLAITILLTGCQSIPDTLNKASFIQRVTDYDQKLTNITSNDTQNIETKLQQNMVLNESEAVLYALNNNAAFNVLLIDLNLAKADLINAGLLPNPELLFAFGVTNKPYRYAIDLPIDAIWSRPIRIRAMKNEADATAYRLMQSGLNLIRDVRIAYAQAVLAKERLSVMETSYLLREKIHVLSIKRQTSGDITGKDFLLAKNDADIAKRDWMLAQFDSKIKMEILLNLLGVAVSERNITLSSNVIPACQTSEIDRLLDHSLAQRPDILAAQFSINAAKERINLSKLSWLKFTGTVDATSGQVNGHTLGPSIRSTIPIANHNQGGISRAESELEKATLNLEALKQQATLEMRVSHLQYQQSCQDWHVLQDNLLPSVQQMIQLTEHAYREGDISYLQTLEANRQFVDTQMREVQLKAELISKWAELTRSLSKRVGSE
jgi:outer membrane protein, heavy metal efflux system